MEQLDEHKRNKKHKKREKEYLVKHPDQSQSSLFKSIQFEVSQDNILSDLAKSLTSVGELKVEEDTE